MSVICVWQHFVTWQVSAHLPLPLHASTSVTAFLNLSYFFFSIYTICLWYQFFHVALGIIIIMGGGFHHQDIVEFGLCLVSVFGIIQKQRRQKFISDTTFPSLFLVFLSIHFSNFGLSNTVLLLLNVFLKQFCHPLTARRNLEQVGANVIANLVICNVYCIFLLLFLVSQN